MTFEPLPIAQGEPTAAESTPLLEAALEAHQPVSRSIDGLVIGRLVNITPEGNSEITLHLPGLPERLTARSLCPVTPDRIDSQCAILFEQGNPQRPIIMGFMHQTEAATQLPVSGLSEVLVDGRCITFDAKEEIVLRCGKASITLTRAGKVLIRGTYVLSRSSGANRIKGGSVQLN